VAIITTDKQMKPRAAHDHYRTDPRLVRASLDLLPPIARLKFIHDPGAGTGVWGSAARLMYPKSIIVGIDPYFNKPKDKSYSHWIKDDYEKFVSFPGHFGRPDSLPSLVMGNPPFSLAEEFIRCGLSMLADGGYLLFLLRLAFLETKKRGDGLWKEFKPQSVHVLKQRPSFYANGSTDDTAYAIYIWKKNQHPDCPKLYWLDWR